MYHTTQQAAHRLGVSPRRVLAIAKARGMAPALGGFSGKFWTKDQIAEMAVKGKPGRPRKPPANTE